MRLLILVLEGCGGYDDAGIGVRKMEDFLMLWLCVKIYQPGSKMSKADWMEYCFKLSFSVNTQQDH